MAGSISTMGLGSGLQLQDILDQLRDVDTQAQIDPKEAQITDYEAQVEEFTTVKNLLFTMKSAALDLSLSSNFLARTVTSSDEDVLTATVAEGATAQSATMVVSSLAGRSSWMSAAGASSQDSIVYVPTRMESSTGVADPAVDSVAASDGTLVLTYGGSSTITVDVGPTAGVTTMNDLVNAINSDAENTGSGANGRMVTASTYVLNGSTYLRIETDTVGGSGESHRVAVTTNDTDLTLSAPAKSFAYTLGDTTTTVSVAADTTLSGLVDLINDDTDNPGATASIINDGGTNPYRLVLQADDYGEDNRITLLTQMPDMTMSEEEGAAGASLNAQFTVDGISYQRQTNTIDDVLSGVTMTLKAAGTASVSVATNDTAIADMVTALVTSYNEVVQEVEAEVAYDEETGEFGTLSRTTLRDLPYELQNMMTATVTADSNGDIQSMFDLGLEFNRDGTITIDNDVLTAAIADYPDGVKAFFIGDSDAGITGLADEVNDRLRTLTSATGQVEAEKNAAQSRIDDLEEQIASATDLLDRKYELLTKQFIELDRYMNQMTSISDYLTSQFNSMASTSSGSSS